MLFAEVPRVKAELSKHRAAITLSPEGSFGVDPSDTTRQTTLRADLLLVD
jgi:hypothetical protein